jgi:uncharacterized delta-60 repeat protein
MSPTRLAPKTKRRSAPARAALAEPLERRALLHAGDLDPTFGAGGTVLTDLAASAHDEAHALLVQPDGKYVVAGSVASAYSWLDSAFGLARYNPDGTLDPTFGTGGRVLATFGRSASPSSLALAPGGRIVACGLTSDPDAFGPRSFAVLRLNEDGTPDATFDGDGRAVVSVDTSDVSTPGLAVGGDGKIVLVGTSYVRDRPTPFSAVVLRLNADGSPDTGFGAGGKAFDAGALTGATSVALDASGRVVVAGFAQGTSPNRLAVARFTAAGVLDAGFDGDGVATAAFYDQGSSAAVVAVAPDGRVVAAGTTGQATGQYTSQNDVAVARFNDDGTPDATFSGDGRATIGFADTHERAMCMAVAADGSVTVGGTSEKPWYGGFALFRLDPSGTPDAAFDGDGVAFGPLDSRSAAGVALGPGGSVVAAGYHLLDRGNYDYDYNFLTVRFTASGAPDATFDTDGAVSTDFVAMSDDRVTAVVVQPDGKPIIAGTAHYGSGHPSTVLHRYNADGTDDTGFVAAAPGSVAALALQPDGKLLTAGFFYDAAAKQYQWVISRFDADGSADTGFGQGGRASVTFSRPGDSRPYAMLVQPDGRIVVAGSAGYQFGAARLLPTGALDPSFGTGGTVINALADYGGPFGGWSTATSVALAPGGKIVLAGPYGSDFAPTSSFAVARYDSAGKPDPAFGTGGLHLYGVRGLGDWGDTLKVAALPGGDLLVGSTVRHPDETTFWRDKDFVLMHLLAGGDVDEFFGGAPDGLVFTDFAGGDDVLHDMVLLPGAVVLVGSAARPAGAGPGTDFGIARYTLSGFPDQSFGAGGKVTTAFAPAGAIHAAEPAAAAVAPGGRLVVAGWATQPLRSSDFTVARYLLTELPPLPQVWAVRVFYNNSAFDGRDPAAGAADDAAVAPGKAPRPGPQSSADDVTGYSRGLNGIMVDVANLPFGQTLTADDFAFRAAAGGGAWGVGPRPASVTVRRGAGVSGTDRVTLVWNDYDPSSADPNRAVANGWLEVTVCATPRTGLSSPSVFRLGNLVGETSAAPATDIVGAPRTVDAADYAATRSALRRPVDPGIEFDVNHDRRVDAVDLALVRGNVGHRLAAPVEPAPAAPASVAAAQRRRRGSYLPLPD